MQLGRRSRDTCPYLLEPGVMVLSGDETQHSLWQGGASIAPRLALHEDELDIVLDDGIGFIGLSKKASDALCFVDSVRNLVPDDRWKVVEPDLPATLLNRG